MSFRTWFETMTSTGDIACFSRPIMGAITRKFPDKIDNGDDDEKKDKKKKKKKDDKKD